VGLKPHPKRCAGNCRHAARLIAVVGLGPIGKATSFQCVKGKISGRVLFDASAPVLPGFAATRPSFSE
jgi:hypothetical protein